jgi:hypothetical protein
VATSTSRTAAGARTSTAGTTAAVRQQVRTERDGKVWPGFDEEAIFELSLERCLLMLTQPEGTFPAGPTIWKGEGMPSTDMVT